MSGCRAGPARVEKILDRVKQREQGVERCQEQFAAGPQRRAGVPENGVVLLVGLHQRKRAFAEHDGGVEFLVEVRLSRVPALKIDGHAGRSRFFAGAAKLALGEIEAGHAVASLGKLDGVAARAAADVQDSLGAIGPQFPLDEVHFAHGSLREGLLVVGFAEIGEERLVPLRHVGIPKGIGRAEDLRRATTEDGRHDLGHRTSLIRFCAGGYAWSEATVIVVNRLRIVKEITVGCPL